MAPALVTSSPLWIAGAGVLLAASFFALLVVASGRGRPSLPLAGTVALALLVCFETLVVNVLSPFQSVTRAGLLAAHGALVVTVLASRPGEARLLAARIGRRLRPRLDLMTLVLGPLLVLVLLSALRYPPNNGDSMEYHLARVAHWMQYRSVAAYPTGSLRQTAMAPGAEYVVLGLQAISGTDRLDALLQLGSFLLIVASAPALARLAGAPRTVAALAAPLMAALPTGLLQASSTQNDVVAAAVTIAVVATTLPFLRRRPRADALRRGVWLAVSMAAAVLVKATALVTALPFLAVAALSWLSTLRQREARRHQAAAMVVAACVALLVVSLESRRAAALERAPSVVAEFTYRPLDDVPERALNALRGLFRNVPAPGPVRSVVGTMPFPHASLALVGQLGPLVPQEDFSGNPVHAALAVCALAAAALRGRSIPARARLAAWSLMAAWLVFHGTFRDNAYVSRLQLPLFALSPMFLGTVAVATPRGRALAVRCARLAVLVAFLVAAPMAAGNYARPPLAHRDGTVAESYYRTFGAERTREPQLRTLRIARQFGCRRIGIFMGESGWDYPLTWQAMEEGIEVRPVFRPDGWPCLIYTEPGSWAPWGLPQPSIQLSQVEWAPVEPYHGLQFLFVRRPGGPATD